MKKPQTGPDQAKNPVTGMEVMVLLALLVYFTVCPRLAYEDHWVTTQLTGPDNITRYMSCNCFLFLYRFIKTFDPAQTYNSACEKFAYLSSHVQHVSRSLYTPSYRISINESMVKFIGHANCGQHMSQKPIKDGIKFFVIAEHGYILAWVGAVANGLDLPAPEKWAKPELLKTVNKLPPALRMVVYLVTRLASPIYSAPLIWVPALVPGQLFGQGSYGYFHCSTGLLCLCYRDNWW